MNRRSLFAISVSIGLMVAGCLGGPSGSNGAGDDNGPDDSDSVEPTDTDTDTGTDTETNTDTETDSPGPTATDGGSGVRETSFEVLDVRSSTREEEASVEIDDGTVSVTGTISGENGCYTARLAEAVLSEEMLVVRVESYEEAAEGRDCTQALVAIDYRASVETTGGSPTSVTVEHNGETVTTISG